jgi:hypothetical protein
MDERKKRRRSSPVPIGQTIDTVMDRIAPERGRLRRILRVWQETLGEEVFLNARPTAIRRGILYVTISDPIWQSELRYIASQLLEKINASLEDKEKIRDIHFRVGYLEGAMPEVDVVKTEARRTEVAVEKLPADLREPVMHVSDPTLKSILARLGSSMKGGCEDEDDEGEDGEQGGKG